MLHDILLVVVGLLIGAVIGFFLARYFMQKYLKKNPNDWLAVFKQLDTAFKIASIEYNNETGETIVMFTFKG